MYQLEKKKREFEYQMESDFPAYEDFLNFFENALLVLDESENAYLIDQIVKLVFLNLTAKDKKVSGYCLQEAFTGFESLKILFGVNTTTPLKLFLMNPTISISVTWLSLKMLKTLLSLQLSKVLTIHLV